MISKKISPSTLEFLLLVLIPFSLSTIYFIFQKADRYESSASFVIRKQSDDMGASPFQGLDLFGQGVSSAAQDAHLLKQFIDSPDLLKTLDESFELRQHYQSLPSDFIGRLGADNTFEDFLKFYRNLITFRLTPEASIVELSVQAFSAEISHQVLDRVLQESEAFINALSRQLAEARVAFVKEQVDDAQAAYFESAAQMRAFQRQFNVIDPTEETAAVFGIISELRGTLARTQAELRSAESRLGANAAPILELRQRIEALESQIQMETERLVNDSGATLTDLSERYEILRLLTEVRYSALQSAQASLEQAQVDSSRQLKFLVVLSETPPPEEAAYPHRLRLIASSLIILLLIFALYKLIVATVREHVL